MTEQHKCDWGPWHPWCSTYRCIHPDCHKNMPSAEVAKRLNEYETRKGEMDVLKEMLDELIDCHYEIKDGPSKEMAEKINAYYWKPRLGRKRE